MLLSGFFFAHKVGQILRVTSRTEDEGRVRTYTITGQVFFASADRFINAFDYKEVIEKVRIDVSRAHFWDITAVSALDKFWPTPGSSCAAREYRAVPIPPVAQPRTAEATAAS